VPGRSKAPLAGSELADRVSTVASGLGLEVAREVRVGRRIWGSERHIDIVVTGRDHRRLGIECKFQATAGTAEEKIPATIQDIRAWPIAGIVVFEGQGFSAHMRAFLISTGVAVEFDDLENWLRLFFGLPLPSG
jgi:hypothetical protein